MDWDKELEKIERRSKNYWLYVLKLEDGCWYVGITKDVKRRYAQHKSGKGAWWTKAHHPIKIVRKELTEWSKESHALMIETAVTMEYIKKYGSDKVRGGEHVKSVLDLPNTII